MDWGKLISKHPARDKIISFIENLLYEGNIDTLPSVRELSSRCGVSASTVWKEIRSLQEAGKLSTRWGHEVKVVKQGESTCARNGKEIKQAKWQQIRNRISNDFLNGRYQFATPLPTTKELQLRYSVSYPTILKALGSLQSTGDIEQVGRGYQIARSQTTARWKSKIVLISAGTPFGEPKITSEREREFYQFLSFEALRSQVDLEQVFYEDWSGKPYFYTPNCQPTNLVDKDNVLGYILSSWHTKDYAVCLRWLSNFNKPVAVWLEKSFENVQMMRSQRAYFNIGYSTLPGRRMGEHFLKLGHRKIAFLSPFHGSEWSQERCAGLCKVYREMGESYKVYPFTTNTASSEWEYLECAANSKAFLKLDKLIESVSDMFHPCLQLRKEQFRYEISRYFRDTLILRSIETQVLQILENKSITAIVAANDLCALLVLDFLKSISIDVPQRISVAGFDNTLGSLTNMLTSYSFNTHSLARAMVRYAIGDPLSLGSKEMQFFEGEVIERATTRALQ